jgi:hypothetical protein
VLFHSSTAVPLHSSTAMLFHSSTATSLHSSTAVLVSSNPRTLRHQQVDGENCYAMHTFPYLFTSSVEVKMCGGGDSLCLHPRPNTSVWRDAPITISTAFTFLNASAKQLRKVAISFVISVWPPVLPRETKRPDFRGISHPEFVCVAYNIVFPPKYNNQT